MNRDPRFALSQELEAKQPLLDQLRALVAEDPDFLTDLIEVETDLELIAALEASILDDEALVDGAKAALDKLQARKRAVETRIEFKRRLLAHALQQIGLKNLRTPTSTLSIAEASLKASAVAPEDSPARWWKPQPPKLDQDGLTRRSASATKPSRKPKPSRIRRNAAGHSPRSRPCIHWSLASPYRTAASSSFGSPRPPYRGLERSRSVVINDIIREQLNRVGSKKSVTLHREMRA